MDKSDRAAAATTAPEPVALARHSDMIALPAGEFLMGTSDAQVAQLLRKEAWAKEWDDRSLFHAEQPQHMVRLPAFAIAAHPVTNAEYRDFVWEAGYRTPRGWLALDIPEGLGDAPVTEVSWADARAYCRWLSQMTGLAFRLPTEAEWERAARGEDGRLYPWGNDFDPWRCNTLESGNGGVTPVGLYSPSGDSPCGAADMAGNVWEWTSSLLHPYPYRADDGREEAQAAGPRVARGGAWYYSRKLARCAAREGLLPTYTSPTLGFRLALSL
jgi:formylglycine-generating enzyme required for sulfatase activity